MGLLQTLSVFVSKSQYVFDNMMYTRLLQLALPLLVSLLTSQAAADCEVEWDSQNVVATQLEGSWALNKELSLVLSPSWSEEYAVSEWRFQRNDSVLYDVIGDYCDEDAWPQIFMAGEVTAKIDAYEVIFPFFVSTLHGNPILFLLMDTKKEWINIMMARAENKKEDILFTNLWSALAWK